MIHIDHTPPEIDYLAKDYASFRRLMLDRLSQLVPDWREQSPADLGHTLVEVLAYAADYLSYYQDAVATEAYLGTARRRRSVRRHVRPLEYYLQEGCNARVWVQIQVNEKVFLPIHTQLLTRLASRETSVISSDEAAYHQALQDGSTVFETMHHIDLIPDHNEIPIFQPENEDYLFKGSTSASLANKWKDNQNKERTSENLKVGNVLVFEEQCDPQKEIANPDHRHAVRLTKITPSKSANDSFVKIEWAAADALPFDLCIAPYSAGHPKYRPSVARGNIVLADHGRRIRDEELPEVQSDERFRPRLRFPDLTFAAPFDPHATGTQPAYQAMQYQSYEAFGWVRLRQYSAHFAERRKGSRRGLLPILGKDTLTISGVEPDKDIMMMGYNWTLRRDLLNSGPFDRDFQVEMEDGRQVYLRFGFGGVGKLPDPGDRFVATYRIGNGSQGNVGAETIAHVIENAERKTLHEKLIRCVCNPMPARGGRDPEDVQSARLHAPYAYCSQKGCVTPADYARRAGEHPAVVCAHAYTRWIGNRRTVMIFVQRASGQPVDRVFQQELHAFIEPCRLMGYDIEIKAPRYVPVCVKLCVYLEPRAYAKIVRQGLDKAFSKEKCPDGEVGFFDPDRFSFGQTVHQSQVIARAMAVPGVGWVKVEQFRRTDGVPEIVLEEIPINPSEIAQLDCIDYHFEGGL